MRIEWLGGIKSEWMVNWLMGEVDESLQLHDPFLLCGAVVEIFDSLLLFKCVSSKWSRRTSVSELFGPYSKIYGIISLSKYLIR